ncbi:MAG: hypothetical protein A2061_08255 [Gallionellales bacterium GWA2_59_43]|nr:MAG: hypothetical protein A2061_08255 [Gallionellales bacterium GWA2_59_43]
MKKLALLMGALLFSGNLYALDTVFVEYGNGDAADMARVGAGWDWNKQWFADGNWLVTGSWEASVGTWRGNSVVGNQTITDIGVTPVFRLQQKHPSGIAPYLEGAIGFHLISPTFIYANRQFGSSFQFGDHLGVGMRFGERQQFDLAYRYQHLSNGGIKQPNQGINFSQIRFAYHF